MILDLIDISILREFYKLSENETKATTWTIMNKAFPNCKNDGEKRAKHNLIKSRIRKMEGDLFEITKNGDGKLTYTLIGDNIKFCKHKFPNGSKDCLMVCLDNRWNIFEI